MSMFLYILSFLAGGAGASLVATAASAVQEIIGMIAILIVVVMFVGAGVIDAVNGIAKRSPGPASRDAGE